MILVVSRRPRRGWSNPERPPRPSCWTCRRFGSSTPPLSVWSSRPMRRRPRVVDACTWTGCGPGRLGCSSSSGWIGYGGPRCRHRPTPGHVERR